MTEDGAAHAPALPALPPRGTRPLAVVGATVLPMTGPGGRADHTVLVDDGVVVAVGPRSEVDTGGADVVDGRGRFLLPGLTDAHVHLADVQDAVLYLAAGVTRVRHMAGRPEHVAYARLVEAGRWAGPRLASASPIVDGLGPGGHPYWAGSIAVDDPADAAPLVARLAAVGYTQLKCYSLLSPAAHAALGRACREHGLALGGHCPTSLTVEQAIANGQTSFEHLCGLGRDRMDPAGNRAYERAAASGGLPEYDAEVLTHLVEHLDRDAVARLADLMREKQVWSCPTLVVNDHPLRPPGAFADADWLRFVPAGLRAMWEAVTGTFPGHDRLAALRPRLYETLLQVVSGLHAAGAPLLVGTDSGNPWVAPGAAVATELENLVAAGLTPYEALRCATVEPARFLGLPDGTGTIAPGLPADLVLLDRDPTATIGAVRDVHAVLVNGWFLDAATLDRLRLEAVETPAPVSGTVVTQGLPPAATTQSAGELVSRVFGHPTGAVGYRWSERPDGARVLDEVEHSRGARTERRLELAPSGVLSRATVRSATPVGTATTTVEVGPDGVTVRTDDHGARRRVGLSVDGPVVAGAGLAVTAALAAPEGTATAVVHDSGGTYLAPVTVARAGGEVTVTYDHWSVPVDLTTGSAATTLTAVDGVVTAIAAAGRHLAPAPASPDVPHTDGSPA